MLRSPHLVKGFEDHGITAKWIHLCLSAACTGRNARDCSFIQGSVFGVCKFDKFPLANEMFSRELRSCPLSDNRRQRYHETFAIFLFVGYPFEHLQCSKAAMTMMEGVLLWKIDFFISSVFLFALLVCQLTNQVRKWQLLHFHSVNKNKKVTSRPTDAKTQTFILSSDHQSAPTQTAWCSTWTESAED